jgi:hypothetical protein
MGDNFKTTLETLAASMQSLQTAVKANAAAIQALAADRPSSSSNGPRSGTGEHHNNRPPRFQKMDFPRYDGKSDPLTFINCCESYFHQQRIMEEEKVWMASYNLEDGAQLWYMQVQTDEGTPSWRRLQHTTCATVRPCVPLHSLSSRLAAAPPPSRSSRTVFKRSWLAPDLSTRSNECSCSRAVFDHRSASTCGSSIRSP